MLILVFILVALVLGLVMQSLPGEERIRDWIWIGSFWVVIPALVFATFLEFPLDRELALAIVAVITSTWTLVGISHLYSRLVSKERDERGALTLAGSLGNTGFIGYPLAQLAFGDKGLSQAVVYDQLSFGVPMSSVSVVVGRLFGKRSPETGARSRLASFLLNPPVWALLAALCLRAGNVHIPHVDTIEELGAVVIGPIGFLQLGISLPLHQVEHDLMEVARATGTMAIKVGGGPLVLFVVATAIGAHIPGPFYLLAAMPPAFHLLVIARVYDMRPALMRLMIVAATIPVVAGVIIGSAIF